MIKLKNITLKFNAKIITFFAIASIFIIFACIFTYPLISQINKKIAGDGGDASLYISWQFIANKQLEQGFNPFGWTNTLRYPVGFNFATSYDGVIFVTLGFLLYHLSSNPIFVYNLSLLILLFLNTTFSYIFFKKISSKTFLGIIGSIIYSFSFYILARLSGHTDLIFIGCFPFFAFSLINLKEKGGDSKSFILFGLSIILTFLSSLHYFIMLVCSSTILLFTTLIFSKNLFLDYLNIFWQKKFYLFLTTIAVFIAFSIFEGQHLVDLVNGTIKTFPNHYVELLSPNITNLFLPNNYSQTLINILPLSKVSATIENALYLGLVEVVLFITFIVSKVGRKIKSLIIGLMLVFLTTTLGCQKIFGVTLPYCYLYKIFPFTALAEVGRYYVILYLILTTGIIIFLKDIKSKTLLLIITILIILERVPLNFQLSDSPKERNDIKVANSLVSKAVFNVPLINQWRGDYNLLAIYYNKPIVGGSIQWLGETKEASLFIKNFSHFECGTTSILNDNDEIRRLEELLKLYDINIISVEKNLNTDQRSLNYCDQARYNINFFLNNSNVSNVLIYNDQNSAIYQLR